MQLLGLSRSPVSLSASVLWILSILFIAIARVAIQRLLYLSEHSHDLFITCRTYTFVVMASYWLPVTALLLSNALIADIQNLLSMLFTFIVGVSFYQINPRPYLVLGGISTCVLICLPLALWHPDSIASGAFFAIACLCAFVIGFMSTLANHKKNEVAFLATSIARARQKQCGILLDNMLPSSGHVNRLLSGLPVVDELSDVAVLFAGKQKAYIEDNLSL